MQRPLINLLVEGVIDDVMGQRLIVNCGAVHGVTFGKRGHSYIKEKVSAFNLTSRGVPLLVLVDQMDTGLDCAPAVVHNYLPNRLQTTIFRVATQEIESWLIADRAGAARFFRVRLGLLPRFPDDIEDPKNHLIQIAGSSSSPRIREGMVPQGPNAATGPQYNSLCVEFLKNNWDPGVAMTMSPSFSKACQAVSEFVERG